MDATQRYRQARRMSAQGGAPQQSGSGHLDQETRLKLGLALRAVYKDSASLPLPKRLTDLLKRLDGRI
jgi:hypothetical protein